MDLAFKIFFGFLCTTLLVCFVGLFYSIRYENKCYEQGGIPVRGICIKAETIKVVY